MREAAEMISERTVVIAVADMIADDADEPAGLFPEIARAIDMAIEDAGVLTKIIIVKRIEQHVRYPAAGERE